MILYNMKYRGPMEYDKFVLNILQLHNEVGLFIDKEFGGQDLETITAIQSQLDEAYELVTGNEKQSGLSEKLVSTYIRLGGVLI